MKFTLDCENKTQLQLPVISLFIFLLNSLFCQFLVKGLLLSFIKQLMQIIDCFNIFSMKWVSIPVDTNMSVFLSVMEKNCLRNI